MNKHDVVNNGLRVIARGVRAVIGTRATIHACENEVGQIVAHALCAS